MPNATSIESLKELYLQHLDEAIEEYKTFLRFPSISSLPDHKDDLYRCVQWLEKVLQKIGFHTELWETPGYPTLFASYMKAGPEKPTLLIYNHYDVQPVDPLDEWNAPPFEPTIIDGTVYARGANDNKGQCFYVLHALRLLIERDGTLPINVKLCIEGEEESGSHGIEEILKSKQKELQADYLAIVDLGIPNAVTPAVTLGIRGIVTMDVVVSGSSTDLHSGSHGGLVFNPLHALVDLLSKLRDKDGKILIPGFYDAVVPVSDSDKKQLNFAFDAAAYKQSFGAAATGGEKAFSPKERCSIRPTIEINGIHGGYGGEGFKTVIPAKAIAKVSCRLVPDMEPATILALVGKFLRDNAPEGIVVEVTPHEGGGPAVRTSPSSDIVKVFATAFSEVFGKPCTYILEGGSIPIVTALKKASGAEVVLIGVGLDSDGAHAPNEHFSLDRLEKGCLIIARGLELLSNTKRSHGD